MPGPSRRLAGFALKRYRKTIQCRMEGNGKIEVFPNLIEAQTRTFGFDIQAIARVQIGDPRRDRRWRVEKGAAKAETKLAIVEL